MLLLCFLWSRGSTICCNICAKNVDFTKFGLSFYANFNVGSIAYFSTFTICAFENYMD